MNTNITGNFRYKDQLLTTGVVSGNGDIVSLVIDLRESNQQGADIDLLTEIIVHNAGSLVFKNILLSNDNTFAVDVTTQDVNHIEHFVKSNVDSLDNAIVQTTLSAKGKSIIGIHPIVKRDYAKVTFTASGGADFTFSATAFIGGLKVLRVNQ